MRVAREEDFKLAMIYQGLDFSRDPLPVATVEADFANFQQTSPAIPSSTRRRQAADDLVGDLGIQPTTTSPLVTRGVRDRLLMLASEKTVDGYNADRRRDRR